MTPRYSDMLRQTLETSIHPRYSTSLTTTPTSEAQVASLQSSSSSPTNVNEGFSVFEQQVLDLTNQERISRGLAPLTLNVSLNQSAEAHSIDMAIKNYFSHQGLDGSLPWDRMRVQGYTNFSLAAENIAFGQPTAQEVVTAWMNSPGHRDNILNPNLKDIGIGFYNGFWTQNFGTLMSNIA